MPVDSGFDSSLKSHALMDRLQSDAHNGKGKLVQARTRQEFNLSSLQDSQVIQYIDRLGINVPGMSELGFDATKLLTGILSGDFQTGSQENVQVYYPHIKDDVLVGKTVFKMGLDDAVLLAKRAARIVGIDERTLKQGSQAMMTRFTLGTQEEFELHLHDISMAIAEKL